MDKAIQRTAAGRIGGALLGAWVVVSASPVAAAELRPAPVRLRAAAIELAPVRELSFDLMTRELGRLLEGAGVGFEWRRARPDGETAPEELRVVFLDTPGRGSHAGRAILGASGQSGPAPTIWVYLPTVLAALDLSTVAELHSFAAQRALGVALGRVLAHEFVHLLAPGVPHGTGVMAPRFRLAGLGTGGMSLDDGSADALASAARNWHLRGGPPPEDERRAGARRPPPPSVDVAGR